MSKAEINVGLRIIGLQRNGFCIVGYRTVKILFSKSCKPPIIVSLGEVRIQSDGFRVIGDGSVKITLMLAFRMKYAAEFCAGDLFCARQASAWAISGT